MINHWTFDGDFNDKIGGANLYEGQNVSMSTDRLGESNKAVCLNSGYLSAPPGDLPILNFSFRFF